MASSSTTTRFSLVGRLYGHTDAINSLAVSHDGALLGSAGHDALRLWDLRSLRELRPPALPEYNVSRRGQVTCVVWLPARSDSWKTLCFSTALGYVALWRETESNIYREVSARRIGAGSEILSLAVDQYSHRAFKIACGTRDQVVQLFTVDDKWDLQSVFTVRLPSTVPKSVAFSDNSRSDVYAFGLYDGQIITLDGRSGSVVSSKRMNPCFCGHASVNTRRGKAAVDNTEDGFSIVDLTTANLVLALPAKVSRRVPKQVEWAHNHRLIVGGSDHGKVYVYDAETAKVVTGLQHDKDGLVQTVTTFDGMDETTILSASSAYPNNFSPFISVWKMRICARRASITMRWSSILVFSQAAILLASLALSGRAYFHKSAGGFSGILNTFIGSEGAESLVHAVPTDVQSAQGDLQTEMQHLRTMMAELQKAFGQDGSNGPSSSTAAGVLQQHEEEH